MEISIERLRFMFQPATLSTVLNHLKTATNEEIAVILQTRYRLSISHSRDSIHPSDVARAIDVLAVNAKSKDRLVRMYLWLLRRNLTKEYDDEFLVDRTQHFLRAIIGNGLSPMFYNEDGQIERDAFFIEFGVLDKAAKAAVKEIRDVKQKSAHRNGEDRG